MRYLCCKDNNVKFFFRFSQFSVSVRDSETVNKIANKIRLRKENKKRIADDSYGARHSGPEFYSVYLIHLIYTVHFVSYYQIRLLSSA